MDAIRFSGKKNRMGISHNQARSISLKLRGIKPGTEGFLMPLGNGKKKTKDTSKAKAPAPAPAPAAPALPAPHGGPIFNGVPVATTLMVGPMGTVIIGAGPDIFQLQTQQPVGNGTAPPPKTPPAPPPPPDPKVIARQQMDAWRTQIHSNRPLDAEAQDRLAQMADLFEAGSEDEKRVKSLQVKAALLSGNKENEANHGLLTEATLARIVPIAQSGDGSGVANEDRQRARRLIDSHTLKSLEKEAEAHGGNLSDGSLAKLIKLHTEPNALSNKQRGRVQRLLGAWAGSFMMEAFPTPSQAVTLLQPPPPGAAPANGKAEVLLGFWAKAYEKATPPNTIALEDLPALERLAALEQVEPAVKPKLQHLISQAAFHHFTQNHPSDQPEINPTALALLAKVKPEHLLPTQSTKARTDLRKHIGNIIDRALVEGHQAIVDSHFTTIGKLLDNTGNALEAPDLVTALGNFDTPGQARQAKDHLTTVLSPYKDYQVARNGLIYKAGPPRVGPPLEVLKIASYNVDRPEMPPILPMTVRIDKLMKGIDDTEPPPLDSDGHTHTAHPIPATADKARGNLEALDRAALQRAQQLGREIEHEKPHVVLLQEVRGIYNLQALMTASGLDKHYKTVLYAPAINKLKGAYHGPEMIGTAILATDAVHIDPNEVRVLIPPEGARPVLEAPVDTGNEEKILVRDVHHKASFLEGGRLKEDNHRIREEERDFLACLAEGDKDRMQVVMGDFNDNNPYVTGMSRVPMPKDKVTYRSRSDRHPGTVLDWAFIKNVPLAEPVIKVQEPVDRKGPRASDHHVILLSAKTRRH